MRTWAAVSATIASSGLCGAAALAWGVRAPGSQLFGRSVSRGPVHRSAIALTFDDGPSETTPDLLTLLESFGAKATFFQCGANVRRLPEIAREVITRGHEIGNHSDTHPMCSFMSRDAILQEFRQAQETIAECTGIAPRLVRAPYGVRWFGFRHMQRELNLLGVMWTVIAIDWRLDAAAIVRRILRLSENGAIVCLHDGRELQSRPDISATMKAMRSLLPGLAAKGYHFETVSQLLCPTN